MNKFYFFIVLLPIFLFGCNTNKEKVFDGYWVIKGDTYERKIRLILKSGRTNIGSIDSKYGYEPIDWCAKDGFFFYGKETLKIISTSKENLRFMKLKGTNEHPVGTEEVWIRVP